MASLRAHEANRKDSLTYSGIHAWVKRTWGSPSTCEACGAGGLTGRKIHWANRSHTYSRERADWMRVCRPCHAAHDRDRLGVSFSRYTIES